MLTTDQSENDCQTERANRVVEDTLRSYCVEHPDSWSATLPMVEFAMNNAVHASTGRSLFYVNGLRHPALPLYLMEGSESGEGGARQFLASQLDGYPLNDSLTIPARLRRDFRSRFAMRGDV
jgi:hypothetical protein